MTRGAPLVVVAVIAGCGSSPPSTFYALAPRGGAAGAAPAVPTHAVKLRRPGLAAYLDRPEIVKRVVDYKLAVADTDRWAAPLDEMLGRVLAQDIEQRVPGASVFTEDGPITAEPEATVEVDVRRLDVGGDGSLNLVAEVAVERTEPHAPTAARAVHLSARPGGPSTSSLVEAMSDLIGQLSDHVAALLRGG